MYKLSPEESKSLSELLVVRKRQDTVNKDRKAKLDRAIMACQAAFGYFDEGVLS